MTGPAADAVLERVALVATVLGADTTSDAVTYGGTSEVVVFVVLAPLVLAAAIACVLARNAVHSALFLVLVMASLAIFYAVQEAPFLAAVQVIVYTGAIMILFLFVLMLVGRDSSDSLVEALRGQRVGAVLAGVGFVGLLGVGLVDALDGREPVGLAEANADGNVQALGEIIYTEYTFPFELVAALLVVATIGAVVLAHKEVAPEDRRGPGRTAQRELSRRRFSGDAHPAPAPGPGVYARHNAVDRPAVLPDGTPAAGSVPPSLEARLPSRGEAPRSQTSGALVAGNADEPDGPVDPDDEPQLPPGGGAGPRAASGPSGGASA